MRITHSWTIIALNYISLKYIKKSLLQIQRGSDRNTKVLRAVTSLSLSLILDRSPKRKQVSKNIEEMHNEINQADLAAMYQSSSEENQATKPSVCDEDPRPSSSFWACNGGLSH